LNRVETGLGQDLTWTRKGLSVEGGRAGDRPFGRLYLQPERDGKRLDAGHHTISSKSIQNKVE